MKKRKLKHLRIVSLIILASALIQTAIYIFSYSLLAIAENHHRVLGNYEVMKWVKKLEGKLLMMY